MRLINVSTFQFEEFEGQDIPKYGILSHTWGKEEVTLQKFSDPGSQLLEGYKKIQRCCELAKADRLAYVWVDTCCIDKTSSAELSEAINSMYKWYKNAARCYVFLSDMKKVQFDRPQYSQQQFVDANFKALKGCRWFTRGWTLQELLASGKMRFHDQNWELIGTKDTMWKHLADITGINREYLWSPLKASVAQKMSWAAKRQTTRPEDMAYCLLGLFDLNMPLLYGEGARAFTRLQHEIIRSTDDESIFAWTNNKIWMSGLLAKSPIDFVDSGEFVPLQSSTLHRPPYQPTNQGFYIELLSDKAHAKSSRTFEVPLRCISRTDEGRLITLQFKRLLNDYKSSEMRAVRTSPFTLISTERDRFEKAESGMDNAWYYIDDVSYSMKPPREHWMIRWQQTQHTPLKTLQFRLRSETFSGDNYEIHQRPDLPAGRVGFWICGVHKVLGGRERRSEFNIEPILFSWSKAEDQVTSIRIIISQKDRMQEDEKNSTSTKFPILDLGDSMAIKIQGNSMLLIMLSEVEIQSQPCAIIDLQVEKDLGNHKYLARLDYCGGNDEYSPQRPIPTNQPSSQPFWSASGDHIYGIGSNPLRWSDLGRH